MCTPRCTAHCRFQANLLLWYNCCNRYGTSLVSLCVYNLGIHTVYSTLADKHTQTMCTTPVHWQHSTHYVSFPLTFCSGLFEMKRTPHSAVLTMTLAATGYRSNALGSGGQSHPSAVVSFLCLCFMFFVGCWRGIGFFQSSTARQLFLMLFLHVSLSDWQLGTLQRQMFCLLQKQVFDSLQGLFGSLKGPVFGF